jgi:lipid II:glycine glycyltransferase (peptidoglycan interpeptide bridge formation enzyme)
MIVREVLPEEREKFNQVIDHPLQSWEWGEFRKKTGTKVIRLGVFEKKELKSGYQLFIHSLPVPNLDLKIIYFPKGPEPNKKMFSALKDLAEREKAVFVRLEPNLGVPLEKAKTAFEKIKKFLAENNCQPGRPLFTRYTFRIDLTKSDQELLSAMKEKTRYNLRLAQKNQVEAVQDSSSQAFEIYLRLMKATIKRQGFYAHTPEYHRQMWQTLQASGLARLLLAKYKNKALVAWILLVFKDSLYYPYGASSRQERQVMPAYAMMWGAIKLGQKLGCRTFDLWGSLGPQPDPKDPWFGWNRFKSGFGPEMIEFLGTYDLVVNSRLYPIIRLAEDWRWKFLRLKSKLPILS